MSYTAAYTQLLRIENGDVNDSKNPRILDIDGLEAAHEEIANVSENTWRDVQVRDRHEDYREYPKREWLTLVGFKTWKPSESAIMARNSGEDRGQHSKRVMKELEEYDKKESGLLGQRFNLERIGIPYEGTTGVWRDVFRETSKYTDPFVVYHSTTSYTFPDLTDFDDGEESVYYIRADDGELHVEERTFERVDTEVLIGDSETQEEND